MTRSRGILAPRQKWTEGERDLLRSMYPECTGQDCAAWLGRNASGVFQMAKRLGIEKSPEFLASDTCGRIQRGQHDQRMIVNRFHKGLTPWNKGTKGIMGQHPNCRRTQFQPGRRPEESRNYVAIGSHRICADGYLERKVTDDRSIVPARRWVAVHRLVWEQVNGSIPKGHIVRFRAGMKTAQLDQITADRLECITRGENASRNHPRNRSPELARLIQLKGAITRQVNRITKESNERSAHQ